MPNLHPHHPHHRLPAPPLLDRIAGEEGTPVSLEFGRPRSDTGKMAKFKLTLFRGHVAERASGGNKSYTGGGGWPEVGQGSPSARSASGSGFVHASVPFGANGVQVTHLPAGGCIASLRCFLSHACCVASSLMHTYTHTIFALPFFLSISFSALLPLSACLFCLPSPSPSPPPYSRPFMMATTDVHVCV